MNNELGSRVEVIPALPKSLHPFHLDSGGRLPALITNGSIGKKPFAMEIGCPIIENCEVARATGNAEDRFHEEFGDSVLGPSFLFGVPYSLVLAREKLQAGIEVLQRDNTLQSFFTTDSAYRLVIPGQLDVTIHKPKKPEDVGTLARLLYEASQVDNAALSSVSGIARYDEATREIEYYSTEAELGNLRQFDMSALTARLSRNGHYSMGTPTYETMDFLVNRPDHIKTHVTKYTLAEVADDGRQGDLNGRFKVAAKSQIESASDDNLLIQLAGIGFIPR